MARLDTILLADDDPDLRDMMATTLAEAGYSVLTATGGYDALGVLTDNWANLLIADIRMPGIDGFELARQAKVMRPHMHVIYISGYSTESAKNAGPIYGPVLKKPMRMRYLIDEINRHLA